MRIRLPQKQQLNILVTRADRIGDLVLSTPVFQALRGRFPSAWIAAMTLAENRGLIEGHPYLNECLFYDKKGKQKGILGTIAFALGLRKKRFDLVIHLHATNRMHWVSWFAGIPIRIGYSRKLGWSLTHRFPDRKREGAQHEASYNFDFLEPLGIREPESLTPVLPISARARRSVDRMLSRAHISSGKPWIVIHPSASCPSKKWPAEKFGKLCALLDASCDAVFFAVGSRGDRARVRRVRSASEGVPVFDLSGRLNLGMLSYFLSKAALLITNDSGPAHIASAFGTPVLSIFGRNQKGLSPARWRPLGQQSRYLWKDVGCNPCLAHRCEINFLCLDAIAAEDVFQAAREMLGERSGRS